MNELKINVKGIDETYLKFPWAGGMNSIQFGEIDLNRDGIKDLFVFDRNGNRKMTFINNGIYNHIDYSYNPEYAMLLPELYDWAIFADYNGDNKMDIFTYSPGWAGIKVYKNVSEDILKFELVISPFLKTLQENGYVNLLVKNVDYPGIYDIDNDGDLDILNFYGLGSFVNYHRNMSMEKYGNADSLDYRLEEYCWGSFAENEESNSIYLDTCFTDRYITHNPHDKERHAGSTLLLLDLDKDTIADLLLGDVDYPGIFALYNDGNIMEAHIGSVDTLFPGVNKKIDLFSFPAAAYIDVNNDALMDLLVSPFDPALDVAENKQSVWYYNNTGANNKPFFNFVSNSFLQSEMIDRGAGAYPVIFDWNKDGLLDLMVGNFGFYQSSYYDEFLNLHSIYQSRIAFYQNTGTEQHPKFQLMDDDVGGLSSLEKTALLPTFDDLDNDGNTDILAGNEEGTIYLIKNMGGNTFEVITDNYADIDIGEQSAPQLFDLNRDGLNDLIIGEKGGNLNYYENVGSNGNPVFEFVSDSLGKINVTDYNVSWDGYSVPWFFRMDDDITRLTVGSEQGKVFFYNNIDDNLSGAFTETDLNEYMDTTGLSFDLGARTAAVIGDLFKDGKPEMIGGNYSGGLEFFNGNADVSPGFHEQKIKSHPNIQIFPNPAKQTINFKLKDTPNITSAEIYNILGVRQMIINDLVSKNGHISIDVSGLENGVYLLNIFTDKAIIPGKFILNK